MHLECIYEDMDVQSCWQAAVIHLILLPQDLGTIRVTSDLAEDLECTKGKTYFKQWNHGKPHPCYKMSWMLKTKIDSKDWQVRKMKVHLVDMKQNKQVQDSKETAIIHGADGTQGNFGASFISKGAPHQLPLSWDVVRIEVRMKASFILWEKKVKKLATRLGRQTHRTHSPDQSQCWVLLGSPRSLLQPSPRP